MASNNGSKWIAGALALSLALFFALPVTAQSPLPAQLLTVARKRSRKPKPAKSAPAISRSQIDLAQQMLRTSYVLGQVLPPRQRVALMTRLLYTMRPDVMPVEKKQWAEELFALAQQLPSNPSAQTPSASNPSEPDTSRNQAIATAAARLAVYDSDRALQLLDSLPSQNGRQPDPRSMAARLVFASYVQHYGALGAPTLLAHAREWGEQGGFPYVASAMPLGRLRPNEDAADAFFRQVLVVFEKEREGFYGVTDFAALLQQAVAMEAIFEDSAEEAGRAVITQLRKSVENVDAPLTPEQKALVAAALNNVKLSAPKAYENAQKTSPALFAPALSGFRRAPVSAQLELPRVDVDLQSAFRELAEAMRTQRPPDEIHAVIARGLQLVNARYKAGACANCTSPDAQSWALISLDALAAPSAIATQLNTIEDPFWHAYFLAIAAQQVGQPNRVADPTSRKIPDKEEAEPE
jgi:hypothetical protein